MGKLEFAEKIPFTKDHINDKKLVIDMLKYENEYSGNNEYVNLCKSKLLLSRATLSVVYASHRHVLDCFNFNTSVAGFG